MKAGDIVRFRDEIYRRDKDSDCGMWNPEKIGLLIEYNTWEKIARILYEGKIISVRAENTQLAVRAKEEI